MAFFSINYGNRRTLSEEQKQFLLKVVPLAKTISSWVFAKEDFIKSVPYKNLLSPSLVLADILINSNWGSHPLAQPFNNKRYSNNLSLLEKNSLWEGKIQKYEGKEYKAYVDWIHFATDYSDLIVFTDQREILKYKTLEDQIKFLTKDRENSNILPSRFLTTLEFYSLLDLSKFN